MKRTQHRLTVEASGSKISDMIRSSVPLAILCGCALLAVHCSEAPEVPLAPTNRTVLAELVSEVG